MTDPVTSPAAPQRGQLEVLVAYWDGKRYPAYHCANDLRLLLTTGRLPSDIDSEQVRRGE